MKRTDIDKRFTQEVVSYIAMGYTVNTESMRGSQGEIAKVDLVKGNDFIRVLLEERTDHDMYMDKVVLEVGRIPEGKRQPGWTVWNNDMEVFFTEEWYKIGRRGYYTTRKEAEAATKTMHARWKAQAEYETHQRTTMLNLEKAAPIVKSFVNRQKGCKTARLANIRKVYKTIDREGKATYHVDTRNHSFKLA